jgi:hypothetical protein
MINISNIILAHGNTVLFKKMIVVHYSYYILVQ